jgi:tRNA-dihydrouridine synthase A
MSSELQTAFPAHRFSIAPMLDWTDRHCRYFLRQLSRHTLLYTEMVTTGAIIHGKGDYLAYSEEEHPVAAAGRQRSGRAGAVREAGGSARLRRDQPQRWLPVRSRAERHVWRLPDGNAQLVADCIKAMRDVVSIPVKKPVSALTTRTATNSCAISSIRSPEKASARCLSSTRKAWLSGLSPKENREIPPLDYPRVYQLKRDFPHLTMSINGGIKSLEEAKRILSIWMA